MNELVHKAMLFAIVKHKDQLDDDGQSYVHAHLAKVFGLLAIMDASPEVLAAGWLHDTIEDTNTSYAELVEEFGQVVAELVMEVTHEGQKDQKGYYFPRLHSKDAILIKFADRLSNLSRMNSWHKDRQEQYLKKSKFWRSE